MTDAFWSVPPAELLADLRSSPDGLASREAARRAGAAAGRAAPSPARRSVGLLRVLGRQLANPISLLLLVAAALSGFVGDASDGAITLVIVATSAGLGAWQEHRAAGAVEALLALLRTGVTVRRDGRDVEVPLEAVVPGDVVRLSAGAIVPGDGVLLDADALHVDEAALTGESFPAIKRPGTTSAETPLADRDGACWLGTHVVSGTATLLVVRAGRDTVYGGLAEHVGDAAPATAFERGVARFGALLVQAALVLGLIVLAINVALDRPVLEALLFTLALVVGLTPQLLPAIVAVTLAHGARRMAAARVIVRRLTAIEDLGGMAWLGTDKTGTLTEGTVVVRGCEDWTGAPSARTALGAALNAAFESGFPNPIDDALRRTPPADVGGHAKLGEVPYDFTRKRLSVAVRAPDGTAHLVAKGAVRELLAVCTEAEDPTGRRVPIASVRAAIDARLAALGREGLRVLGVAWRPLPVGTTPRADDERALVFCGFLVVEDPLKPGAAASLAELRALGIRTAMITGDNRHVAAHVAAAVGLDATTLLTGAELDTLDDVALAVRAPTTDVFAEVEPRQKERIIRAVRRAGIAAGYLGDGINDAAALHAADVGISVDSATDATRRAADVVLLDKDLAVLGHGVREGRRAFANTLKYVGITTSANFGNMVSLAVASATAPFLPLLPKQILLNNLLSDLPALGIATDRLDPELVAEPRTWDTAAIRRFMIAFGLVSSAFDLATFALLRWLDVPPATFRTAWFLESLLTELAILLVIRTRRPAVRSRPSSPLLWGTAAAIGAGLVLVAVPPLARLLGFAPLGLPLLGAVVAIVLAYALASEATKRLLLGRLPL